MECTVFTPCGRYEVHYQSDGFHYLRVNVYRNSKKHTNTTATDHSMHGGGLSPSHYTATLEESQVRELTTAAGVRKSFPKFAEMTYHALIGRASCVKFFVETCDEMRRRIAVDVEQRRGQNPGATGHRNEETTINMSVCSDVADDLAGQRFFTVDYDVDFTRAVFPVPLDPVFAPPLASDAVRMLPPTAAPTTVLEDKGTKELRNRVATLESDLVTARQTADKLQADNDRLREENAMLNRLSREKMHEMHQLCEDFQGRVHIASEVERLRAKNTQLRVSLRATEEAREAAERALDAERRRRLSASREPSPRNPYLRSLSRDVNQPGRLAHSHSCRQPLVSPTPPSVAKRRPTGRFDTPPPATREYAASTNRVSRSGSRAGGCSPAPRDRTGGRPGLRNSGRTAGRRADRLPSRAGSVCSSVASSSVSHERLHRATTVSSRSRQSSTHRASSGSPIRRAVFR